jgi:proline dehydrogenase
VAVSVGDAVAARLFPLLPRRVARGLSARYIAGERVADAVAVGARLADRGLRVTLDVLGESVRSEVEAAAYADQYIAALGALDAAGLEPHVSVKPSALGSLVDSRICEEHVARIAEAAQSCDGLVCLDMEWSRAIDGTLALYRHLRDRGFENVTMVAQARLHRTRADLVDLAPLAPHVRICKGIYPEPASVAYTDFEAIRRNYVFCLDTVLASGGFAAVATHDEALVVAALERLAGHDRSPYTYEFQMLLGVRQDLAESLASAGHRVRIYVPYGNEWHAYARRRLIESPHIVGYVMRAQWQNLAQVGRKKERVPA